MFVKICLLELSLIPPNERTGIKQYIDYLSEIALRAAVMFARLRYRLFPEYKENLLQQIYV